MRGKAWVLMVVLVGIGITAADGQAERPFTDEEMKLLPLQGSLYHHNWKAVAPFEAVYKDKTKLLDFEKALLHEAVAAPGEARKKRANLLLAQTLFTVMQGKFIEDQNNLINNRLPKKWAELHVKALLDGLREDGFPSLDTLRDGPGRDFLNLSHEWWAKENGRTIAGILQFVTQTELVKGLHPEVARSLGRRTLPDNGRITARLHYEARGDIIDDKVYNTTGRFVRFVYLGDADLTGVFLMLECRTTGASAAFTDRQLQSLASLGVVFPRGIDTRKLDLGGEQAAVILNMLARNVQDTMPHGRFAYVPRIKKGDVIDVFVGDTRKDAFVGVTFSLYSDQGKVETKEYVKPVELHEMIVPDLLLIGDKGVRADVGIADWQFNHFKELVKRHKEYASRLESGELTAKQYDDIKTMFQVYYSEVLSYPQARRLQQLSRQQMGLLGIYASAGSLGLTRQQLVRINNLMISRQKKAGVLFQKLEGQPEELNKAIAELDKGFVEQGVNLLTAKQKDKWKELRGDAYQGVFPAGFLDLTHRPPLFSSSR